MEVKDAGWSLLFEIEAKVMRGAWLYHYFCFQNGLLLDCRIECEPTLLWWRAWLFLPVLVLNKELNRLKSSCGISRQVPDQGRNLNGMLGPSEWLNKKWVGCGVARFFACWLVGSIRSGLRDCWGFYVARLLCLLPFSCILAYGKLSFAEVFCGGLIHSVGHRYVV